MTTSELITAISIILGLLFIPVIVMILVRILIPLKPVTQSAEEFESPLEFDSLRDFWDSNLPHLRELRDRIVKSLIAIGIGTGIGFWLVSSDVILGKKLPDLIHEHFAPNVPLQGIDVAEVFVSYMRMALVVGVAIAIPLVLYQIIAFLAPGLHPSEKRVLFTALPFASELFLAGMAFGWFFTVPAAVQFLTTFGTGGGIQITPRVENFFSIVATLLLWNGLVFELPAIVYLLARIGLVNTKMLGSTRRYAIVIITIAAAIITPTGDPYNLLLLAIPMYLLYEMGIQLTRFVPKPKEQA